MPRHTVSQRLRARLRELLRPWGMAAALSRYSQSGNKPGILPQELSYFLRDTPGRRGITLDDLDDIAGFFHKSIGELLGDTKPSQLSGDEQRMIYAFRALPPPVREHFLSLIEQASLAPAQKHLPLSSKARIREPQLSGGVVDAPARVPAHSAHSASETSGENDTAELRRLRESLRRIVYELSVAATGAVPDEPVSGARAEEA